MRTGTALRSLILAAAVAIVPAVSHAGIFVSIGIGAPPPLPVYVQPELPAPGYIWTPGYWSYDEDGGYYWVPGAWVLAPYPGALWTPGYWAFEDEGYGWHPGYWGLHVGFYGGVNYGCGYFGRGFEGGYWDHDRYFYNRSVTRITNVNVTNVYNQNVINNYNHSRTSFDGGNGGLQARPTTQELAYTRERHIEPLAAQRQNELRAEQDRHQFAAVNHGQPLSLARVQPAVFNRNATVAPVNRSATNLPVNRAPLANNGGRGNAPLPSPAVNGQRPLITAHPGNAVPLANRPAPPSPQTFNRQSPVYGAPRAASPSNNGDNSGYNNGHNSSYNNSYPGQRQAPVFQRSVPPANNGYPARPQQTYNRPQPQAPVYSDRGNQRGPAYSQRPFEAQQARPQPQARQEAPQYRQPAPQPQYRQPAAQPQFHEQPQQQSRPQEFHGGPGGGHGGRG